MYLLLFGFWVLLNGKWNAEIAIVGAIICAALYAFMTAFMGYSPKKEWQLFKRLPRIIGYFFYLVKEISLSSWQTMKLIWSPDKEIEPRVTSFHTRLRTEAGRVVLANSITMTPGTITVDVQDDLFLIHCLDESFDMGSESFEMERRIARVEGSTPVQPDAVDEHQAPNPTNEEKEDAKDE
ncbi:MAG: Na+/H+ antiporter subunit E [Clostridiales bacterium]|nr:Na+/H+ antiporter subunit E [Clostridiales bacterium]